MWKGIVGDCSTVWIVTEINRAASEKEAWEILESVSSLIGNGGECQQIHFICTKSDVLDDSDDLSSADIHDRIVKRNLQAKDGVRKAFNKRTKIKKHFTDDSFKVFTVSSKEFLKGKHLSPEETEITKLQGFLQELNDCHSETVNYVSGAHRILSLIQGANSRGVGDKKGRICAKLERITILQLDNVRKEMEKTFLAFEKCLADGVEKSKRSYGEKLKNFLYQGRNSGFCGVLKQVVENGGVYKPKNGKLINLNMKLASCLTDSIGEEFRKTFLPPPVPPARPASCTFFLDSWAVDLGAGPPELYVSTELDMVKKHYDQLAGTPDDEVSLTGFADWVETAEAWSQTGFPRGSAD
ncbi:unnamed protein product [Oreochromis niloticus]|nr:unnamed protein product [Mustela putorius furo]